MQSSSSLIACSNIGLESEIIADLFLAGNYVAVARCGPNNLWQTHVARGLIGLHTEALETLREFPSSPEIQYYRAVICWLIGDDEQAAFLLNTLASPEAKRFYSLISKPKIEVLAQLPWHWQVKDKKFEIVDIGYGPDDLPNRPYADIHTFYSRIPDFFLSFRYEHADIPPNLYELKCPKFGVVADYVVQIHSAKQASEMFDSIIVSSPSEWRDLQKISGRPVVTFPKLYSLPEMDLDIPCTERPIDFFVSGTILSPYFPEKAELLNRVLEIPNINLECLIGYSDSYLGNLARSKASFSYVQHADGMPTRALESLALGACVLVQPNCGLLSWVGAEEGLVEYHSAKDLTSKLIQIKSDWPRYEARARRGAEIVRANFRQDSVVSQNLRFCTFLASRTEERKWVPRRPLHQKECVFFRGFLLPETTRRDRQIQNCRKFNACAPSDRRIVDFIDTARDLVLEYG